MPIAAVLFIFTLGIQHSFASVDLLWCLHIAFFYDCASISSSIFATFSWNHSETAFKLLVK